MNRVSHRYRSLTLFIKIRKGPVNDTYSILAPSPFSILTDFLQQSEGQGR